MFFLKALKVRWATSGYQASCSMRLPKKETPVFAPAIVSVCVCVCVYRFLMCFALNGLP